MSARLHHSCIVCGSSAPITRMGNAYGSRPGETYLCYYHEYVCGPHLLDPCPECDAR